MPACGNVESDETTKSSAQAITNGVNDLDAPMNNAVFHVNNSSGSCSGSLITSTVGLTAVHCRVSAGDVLSFGVNNPNAPAPLPSRATRVVQKVRERTPGKWFDNPQSTSLATRAKDVALVWFWPPVTMDASPAKPTLQRPPLTPGGGVFPPFAVFAGGGAGYGLAVTVFGGEVLLFTPLQRQVFESAELTVRHVSTGDGFAVWVRGFRPLFEPGGLPGDSGGPLFQAHPHLPGARDVLGVSSGRHTPGCPGGIPTSVCQTFGSDPTMWFGIYADITAPSIKSWIEAELDRNGDGRWEGQVDYVRTAFGIPGAPGFDPGCDVAKDPDCDLIVDQNDNCPLDYNPDQENSDDPSDPWDRTSAADPGDVCDLCPGVAPDGGNCNDDAEQLAFGPRPRIRENHVISTPLLPSLSEHPLIAQNRQRYRGDACDPTPCTELAQREITLDPTKYGAPSPTDIQCLLGGNCAWTAPARIERHAQIEPIQSGGTGQTGYRFCQCDPPFNDRNDRFLQCFTSNPCPRFADDFGSNRLREMTISPALATIQYKGTPETVTNDTFTYQAPNPLPGFQWLFENDQFAIMGTPNPIPPLTDPSQVAIDGLIHSNVRNHARFLLDPGARDLASYWMPMQMRFRLSSGSIFIVKEVVKLPGWWRDACKNDPNCRFAFSVPLYVYPYARPSLVGLSPAHQSDLSDLISPAALSLLGAPGATVIPAAEHGNLLALRDARSAPRVAVVDLQTLTFVGALAQRADGGFSEFGRRFDDGDIGPLATTSGSGALAASAATLSALHGKVFVLGRQSSHGAARLHVYDIAARTWTETPLTGAHLPEDPVALTYLAPEDALFALGRKKGPGAGAYHLFRISLRGAVQRLAIGGGGALKSEPFLTPTEDGALLLSASRQGSRYRIAKLVVAGNKVAHSAGRLEASGTLAAAPFLTRRAVTIGLGADDDPLEVIELPTTALAPPKAGSHGGNDGSVLWPVR